MRRLGAVASRHRTAANRFDTVSVGIDYESRVVRRIIGCAYPRRAIRLCTGVDGLPENPINGAPRLSPKRQMKLRKWPRRRHDSEGPGMDTETGGITVLHQETKSKRLTDALVETTASRKVAYRKVEMIDHDV
jgi:hypothetical protein